MLKQFPYTEAVVKETLRLWPPAPMTTRAIDQNFSINGRKTNKEMEAYINIMGLHYSEKYWLQPSDFIPERFLVRYY